MQDRAHIELNLLQLPHTLVCARPLVGKLRGTPRINRASEPSLPRHFSAYTVTAVMCSCVPGRCSAYATGYVRSCVCMLIVSIYLSIYLSIYTNTQTHTHTHTHTCIYMYIDISIYPYPYILTSMDAAAHMPLAGIAIIQQTAEAGQTPLTRTASCET